jgi:hypothetical protein
MLGAMRARGKSALLAIALWPWPAVAQQTPSTTVTAPKDREAPDTSVRLERPVPTPAERLQKVLEDDAARERLRTGRVHPRLYDIGRTAQQTFDPSWALVEDHPRKIGSMGNTASEMGKSVLRSWVVQAPRYATNTPMPAPPRHPGTVRPGEEDDPTMIERYDAQVRNAIDDANSLSSIVCLDLAPGRDVSATVARTSGRGRFDRLVRASALAAARAKPLPADLDATRACYRFTAHFATVPPVPYFGCTLEKSERTDDRCVYPFKRIVARDVELISVK